MRGRLEAEQNKCARIITGCLRATRKDTLLSEADLPTLSLRALQLAGTEYQRVLRLPPSDPGRSLFQRRLNRASSTEPTMHGEEHAVTPQLQGGRHLSHQTRARHSPTGPA